MCMRLLYICIDVYVCIYRLSLLFIEVGSAVDVLMTKPSTVCSLGVGLFHTSTYRDTHISVCWICEGSEF